VTLKKTNFIEYFVLKPFSREEIERARETTWNSPRRWGGGKRAVSRVWFEEKASWLWWYRL